MGIILQQRIFAGLLWTVCACPLPILTRELKWLWDMLWDEWRETCISSTGLRNVNFCIPPTSTHFVMLRENFECFFWCGEGGGSGQDVLIGVVFWSAALNLCLWTTVGAWLFCVYVCVFMGVSACGGRWETLSVSDVFVYARTRARVCVQNPFHCFWLAFLW